MTDHGPHSHVCADADGGVCHCDCHGRRHGVRHVPGGRIEHDPEVHVRISRIHKPGGGYRVVDRKTGLPPGGGTPDEKRAAKGSEKAAPPETKEQRIARRMAEVTTKTQGDLDGRPQLSTGLKARVDRARESLPADRKAWMDPLDNNKANAERTRGYLAKAQDRLTRVKAERAKELEHFEKVYGGDFPKKIKDRYRAEFDTEWDKREAAAREDVARNEKYLHEAENPAHESHTYPTKDGRRIAPPEWKAHLKTVMGVGREALAEHRATLGRDPEYKRLRDEAERLEAAELDARNAMFNPNQPAGTEYREWSKARRAKIDAHPELKRQAREARAAVAQHDQRQLMAMLGSHREFGGAQHDVVLRTTDEPDPHAAAGQVGQPQNTARPDAEQMMRDTEKFYPTDWVKASAGRGKLNVGTSPRAFYSDGRSYLSQPTADGSYSSYVGGHGAGDYAGGLDVSIHELGHRMEKTIPGLTQLEMAFVLDRSTAHDGTIEEPKQMAGYAEREIAYHDTWASAYAGKVYDSFDPGTAHWEVFQVGVQDTYGRHNTYDKSDDLQSFVIGALLTL